MTLDELRFWINRIGAWERQGLTDSTGMPADPNPMPRLSWLPWRKRR